MDIQNRLENLSPTPEVVNYYRSKCEKYEQRIGEMLDKLEEYRLEHEQQFKFERRLRDVTDQNENLRQSLSKLREHLFEERENMLRIKSENGRLRLQELEDRKKIHHLLTFRGCQDENMIALFMERGLDVGRLVEQLETMNVRVADGLTTHTVVNFALQTDNEILTLQVKSLQAVLTDRIQFALHERAALVQEKQSLQRDHEIRKANDTALINSLTDRLKTLHNTLHKDISGLPSRPAKKAVSVPELYPYSTAAERENVAPPPPPQPTTRSSKSNGDLLAGKSRLTERPASALAEPRETGGPCEQVVMRRHRSLIEDLQRRLKRSEDIRSIQEQRTKELRDKVNALEQDVAKRGEPTESKYAHLKERIQVLQARNEDLERRRKLDNEGFQSDVKILRQQLHSVEKQLLKCALNVGSADANVDLSVLEAVRRSAPSGPSSQQAPVKLKDLRSRLGQPHPARKH